MVHRSPFHSARRPFERLHRLFEVTPHAGALVEALCFIQAERRSFFE